MIIAAILLIVTVGAIAGRGYIMLATQIPRYQNYWNQRAKQSLDQNELRYFALGDSAAQAIGASRPEKGYVGLLADRLAAASGRPVRVINLSETGAKASDVFDKQLPRLLEYQLTDDDVISLAIGGNNVRGLQPDEFRGTMELIMRQLPKQTVVGDVPYFGGGRYNESQNNALTASQIIGQLAQDKGLRLAPLQQVTKDKDSWRNYAADFFHPSDYGYQWWAEAFWTVLSKPTGS